MGFSGINNYLKTLAVICALVSIAVCFSVAEANAAGFNSKGTVYGKSLLSYHTDSASQELLIDIREKSLCLCLLTQGNNIPRDPEKKIKTFFPWTLTLAPITSVRLALHIFLPEAVATQLHSVLLGRRYHGIPPPHILSFQA